jgi:hypothetical protein
VGGIQSRVATPVVALAGVALLLFDATVEPEAGVVVDGAVALDDVPDAGVALETAAVFDATVAVVAVSAPGVRSIVPAFEDARPATVSEAVDAAAVLLDPSPPPQAAKVSVASVHRTTLRTCERAANVEYVINRFPG